MHGAAGGGEGRRKESSRPHEHFLFGLHERGAGDVPSSLVPADQQGHFQQPIALRLQKKRKGKKLKVGEKNVPQPPFNHGNHVFGKKPLGVSSGNFATVEALSYSV